MKNAKQWREEYNQDRLSGQKRRLVFHDDSFVTAVQLDAFKAGMKHATNIASDELDRDGAPHLAMLVVMVLNRRRVTLEKLP